jgi:hypothetical protein
MALDTTKAKLTNLPGSDVAVLLAQFNNLCDVVRAMGAALDADGGVTATTFAAAVDAGVTKITDVDGTEQ